jgi:hypothetical protein
MVLFLEVRPALTLIEGREPTIFKCNAGLFFSVNHPELFEARLRNHHLDKFDAQHKGPGSTMVTFDTVYTFRNVSKKVFNIGY